MEFFLAGLLFQGMRYIINKPSKKKRDSYRKAFMWQENMENMQKEEILLLTLARSL